MFRRAASIVAVLLLAVNAACAEGEATPDGQGGSPPAPSCAANESRCDDACVDTASDPEHCGACGKACGTSYECIAGKCLLVCEGGSKVCGDRCADVAVDPEHCGECGKACPVPSGGVAVCVEGSCAGACKAPFEDCNYDLGDGCEADTSVSTLHCGACSTPCPQYVTSGTAACKGGTCEVSCSAGRGDCNGKLFDGCETDLTTSSAHCGTCGTVCDAGAKQLCVDGACKEAPHAFAVLDKKDIVYGGLSYLLLKVKFLSTTAVSDSWCQEYTNLCQSFGYKPTGCGAQFLSAGYGECKSKYLSDGVSDSLGCNPSGGVASAAQQNGYFDADPSNSFGFHYCDGGSCSKTMCSGTYCNSALSYIDASKPHGYTLCKK